jgi:hypothetical protein
MPGKTKKGAAALSQAADHPRPATERDLGRHNQRERELIQPALIEGEDSGVSERSVSDIARQAKRRLQRAQV